jgi:sigma-E factor negative regulatory protein RseC
MLTEVGRVVAIEDDSLWIETLRQSTCGACVAQKGCGHGLLNRMGSRGRNYIRVLLGNQLSAQFALDDQVRIAIPEQVVVRSSVVVYLLPLSIMLLLAVVLAQAFPRQPVDLMASLGAVLGFMLGIALVRLHAWWYRDDVRLQPRLLGRVASTPLIESPEMT